MKRLHVHLLPDSPPEASDLCKLYWEHPDRPSKRRPFRHRTEDLAVAAGLTRGELTTIVASTCFVTQDDRICRICGHQTPMFTRGDFDMRMHMSYDAPCPGCYGERTILG